MKKFYITTPIYYVNDEPHIGHAYCTVLADVFARYHRLLGNPTYFLTGTDEHGQKLQDTALNKGIEPQRYCDDIVKGFKETWRKLNIKNDDFIRTTEKRHIDVVTLILKKLYESKNEAGQSQIYDAEYEGWYCKYEERYWTEKDLVEGKCPECNRPVQRLSEKNYFFRMSFYQDWLVDYIKNHPQFIQPDFRRNEVLGFLKQPLGDLCISRPKKRLSWGIPLPFDEDYVCYVWFDALINYISAIGYNHETGEFEKDWWPAVHLIGKDILTTHAVYWPCMLKAIGFDDDKMPKTIFATGWWLQEGAKMSKSVGNVIKPLDLVDKYGVDPFRFYLIREMTLGQDATFSEESFIKRYNSELANDLGNLLSRTVKMISSYCDGKIPDCDGKIPEFSEQEKAEQTLDELPYLQVKQLKEELNAFRLNSAVDNIMSFVRSINRFIEHNKPWVLAKQNDKLELNRVLYVAAESLFISAVCLHPIIPSKSEEIISQLGHKIDSKLFSGGLKDWGNLQPGTKIKPGESLFPRLQKVKPETENSEKGEYISFDDFKKADIRVAEVISADKVTGADKLLQLQIKIGKEQRQIVAGIAKNYSPEDLIGKKIIVVVNLQPVKIRGIESNGMLLAATSGKKLVLLTTDMDIESGAGVS